MNVWEGKLIRTMVLIKPEDAEEKFLGKTITVLGSGEGGVDKYSLIC